MSASLTFDSAVLPWQVQAMQSTAESLRMQLEQARRQVEDTKAQAEEQEAGLRARLEELEVRGVGVTTRLQAVFPAVFAWQAPRA